MRPYSFLSLAITAALAAGSAAANPVPEKRSLLNSVPTVLAPLYTPPAAPGRVHGAAAENHVIDDSYIIVLKDDAGELEAAQHLELVQSVHAADLVRLNAAGAVASVLSGVKHVFDIGDKNPLNDGVSASGKSSSRRFRGYSGRFSEQTVELIRSLPEVRYVERDSVVYATETEKGAPWGLARISHRKSLSLGTFSVYDYDSRAGEGVDAYVIDTGVNVKHAELEGRAVWGKTIPDAADIDDNGHGSHVAGTIASNKYGVAKKARIIAVKVLGQGGSGTMSDVVAGVAWAADDAAKQASLHAQGKNSKYKGSVANMSLGGGKSQALDDAVDAAVDDGLHFAVAAGNDNRDACQYSPASSKNAITVGASAISDARAYFSNHGECVDVFAPGLNILSIWNSGENSVNTISGTSMASPHVAGLVAYFLSLYPESFGAAEAQSTASDSYWNQASQLVMGQVSRFTGKKTEKTIKPIHPKELKKALEKISTRGILTDLPEGTPNLLIYNNFTVKA